ncbi:IS66 family transposase zinc-finger binding domain-containing protein [Solidesulfovibrio alcoholivorans]|uniref:IS66 family transposase zinc-finger binding domain-containing protein n=1 Tax=Solidesulfovibrio alcoholivorans TaxID=81406 RepID=UPI000694C8B5|nr:IS66 family transposase zinc-finger binding domain-containing protein [Solidesulfovibrio alcoholivorans]
MFGFCKSIRFQNLIISGPKSEKKPRIGQEQQLSLFDEAEQTVEERNRRISRRPALRPTPAANAIADPFPLICPGFRSSTTCPCGAVLVRIGEEVSEKLDIVPAKIQVVRHIRPQ